MVLKYGWNKYHQRPIVRVKQKRAYQVNLVLREQSLGFLVVDRSVDDNILALLPVHRCSDLVFIAELKSVNDTDDLVLEEMNG